MTKGIETPVRFTHDGKTAEEWELVLIAQGLSPSLARTEDGFIIKVPEDELEKAYASLSAYDRENVTERAEESQPAQAPNWPAGIIVAEILFAFYCVTVM